MPPANGLSRAFVICVEGNIASGKTTLVNLFKKHSNVHALEEPVKKWRAVQGPKNSGTHNLLQLLYEDPKRWSFAFQHYVQLTMLKLHEQRVEAPIKLMERSIHSARHCFVENLHTSGMMTSAEYIVLVEWYDWICSHRPAVRPDAIVYLKTSPEVVLERIRRRGRPEESEIPLEYLKALNDLHEKWLKSTSYPVITVDGDRPFHEIESEFMAKNGSIFDGIVTEADRVAMFGE